jgi:hypothetical protein
MKSNLARRTGMNVAMAKNEISGQRKWVQIPSVEAMLESCATRRVYIQGGNVIEAYITSTRAALTVFS